VSALRLGAHTGAPLLRFSGDFTGKGARGERPDGGFLPGEPGNAIRFLDEGPGPAVIVRLRRYLLKAK